MSLQQSEGSKIGKEVERGTSAVTEQLASFKVWNPPSETTTRIPRELPDSYFEPTTAELKASYQAQVRATKALVNAPLKTQEMRERENKSKLARWPTTTIRVRFPDRTQLEQSFQSTDKIRSVYAFVRNSIRDDVKSDKFVLYQTPPRRELKVSDPNVRDLSLFELQLAPSSVLLLSFQDETLNGTFPDSSLHLPLPNTPIGKIDANLRAPLLESILAQAQDLPPPPTFDDTPLEPDEGRAVKNESKRSSNGGVSKGLPKWLRVGQSKSIDAPPAKPERYSTGK